jgi:hypothetical protein
MLSYFDFVIGENIEIGKSITNQSRKLQNNAEKDGHRTTESYVQTNFYILLTLSDDYPRPVDLEKTQTENNIVYPKKKR